MNHIELFAGCGGLSLGLKSVESNLLLANELSPMAAETFAFNFLKEDLSSLAQTNLANSSLKTKWLSSRYVRNQMTERLRENPQAYPSLDLEQSYCDLPSDGVGLKGSLVVGSIVELNKWLTKSDNKQALSLLKKGFGHGQVDLVSGGPPCQSFSMAGMREYTNSRNVLPWEFAKFVELVQPKFALLENVTGILRPFQIGDKKVYAWFEVAQAFAQIKRNRDIELAVDDGGYVPLCLHVNAKFAGVAQNRPRFIMLSFRRDVFENLKAVLTGEDLKLLASSEEFFYKVRAGEIVTREDLQVYDAEKFPEVFEKTFLKPLVDGIPASVAHAIGDLNGECRASEYVVKLNTVLGKPILDQPMQNHVHRTNSHRVKRRFRIYQILSLVSPKTSAAGLAILNRKKTALDEKAWLELSKFTFYIEQGEPFQYFETKSELETFLLMHRTSKRTQKALMADVPAPATLSIPDDACHYLSDVAHLRTLTVREMARIQSFPDQFTFRSKATTGGQKRKWEVPQYTQVGNAVPPLLGRALGQVVQNLLRKVESFELAEDFRLANVPACVA